MKSKFRFGNLDKAKVVIFIKSCLLIILLSTVITTSVFIIKTTSDCFFYFYNLNQVAEVSIYFNQSNQKKIEKDSELIKIELIPSIKKNEKYSEVIKFVITPSILGAVGDTVVGFSGDYVILKTFLTEELERTEKLHKSSLLDNEQERELRKKALALQRLEEILDKTQKVQKSETDINWRPPANEDSIPLSLGIATFRFPRKWIVERSQSVELLIQPKKSEKKHLSTNLTNEQASNILDIKNQEIKITKLMEVKLISDEFKICSQSSNRQPIIGSEATIWKWHLTPLKAGLHHLSLTISIIGNIPESNIEVLKDSILEQNVTVLNDFIYTIKLFTKEYEVIFIVSTVIIIGLFGRKIYNYTSETFNLQNAQFGGGIANADKVNVQQMGGNITNRIPEE